MYHQLYRESQDRVAGLMTALAPQELALTVPACPLWSVREVLAHLAGVSASFVDGSGATPASTDWTRGHLDARREHTVEQMLAEWRGNTPALAEVPADSRSWLPILHDTMSHEADIRGAIGAPRIPGDALGAAYPLLLGGLQRRLSRFGTVRLDLTEQPVDLGDGEPDLVVQTTRFEFWRATFGRRSPDQMRSWVRRGDAQAFAVTLPVFPPRDSDLVEAG